MANLDYLLQFGEILVVEKNGSSSKNSEMVVANGVDCLNPAQLVPDLYLLQTIVQHLSKTVFGKIAVLAAQNDHILSLLTVGIYVLHGLKPLQRHQPRNTQRLAPH